MILPSRFGAALLSGVFVAEASALQIVQLGDSYASGNGAGSYFGGSCYRSAGNWGNTAANLLNADSYDNQACSGSTVSALSSQDTAVDSSTDVVLVGVGGNDLGFADVVLQCFIPFYRSHGECNDMMDRARNRLPTYQIALRDALLDVFDQLNDNAFVVLVSYPHITENTAYTANCCGFSNPNWDIINGLRDLGDTIDGVQRDAVSDANNAASRTFAYFYDGTKSLFEGHEPDPDADRVNGDRWIHEYGVEDFEVYHLNSRGHSELGKAVAPFVENLLPSAPATPFPTPIPTPNPTPPPTTTSPGTTPSPTPAPVATTDPDNGGGICFSEIATVQVENQSRPVAMKDLRLGDRVLVNDHVYQPIYAFAHHHTSQPANFLQIHFTSENGGGALEISAEHMLFVAFKRGPVRADFVRVGDELIRVGSASSSHKETASVTKITTLKRNGLYAPLTREGTLVVNGILASSYVGLQRTGTEYAQLGKNNHTIDVPLHHATLTHLWLSPLRLICASASSNVCASRYHRQEDGMHPFVSSGFKLVAWGEKQPVILQAVLLLLVLAVLVVIHAIELLILGGKQSSIQLLLLGSVIVVMLGKLQKFKLGPAQRKMKIH